MHVRDNSCSRSEMSGDETSSIIIFMTEHRLDCDAGKEPKDGNGPNRGGSKGELGFGETVRRHSTN